MQTTGPQDALRRKSGAFFVDKIQTEEKHQSDKRTSAQLEAYKKQKTDNRKQMTDDRKTSIENRDLDK